MQATMKTPPTALVSMMRGLFAAYCVVLVAYFPVASAGYAAFGNAVSPDVLLSVRKPAWLISTANFMVVIHLAASFQVIHPSQSPSPPVPLPKRLLPYACCCAETLMCWPLNANL
jgi:hypothetical protein